MKKYRFDYIREQIADWDKEMVTFENVRNLPFRISPPSMGPGVDGRVNFLPSMDPYGNPIDDMDDWIDQRNDYIEELVEKIKKDKKWKKF